MKNVLVINIGWEQEPLVQALAQRDDIRLYGIHYNTDFNSDLFEDVLVISDLRDLETIIRYADTLALDAVFSDQCDYSNFAQAFVAYRYGLPGPDIESAQLQSNKYLQRIRAKEKGILVPEFQLVSSENAIKRFAQLQGYPVIVKSVDNRGSFGITKVNDESEIKNAFIQALQFSHSRLVLVEQFIDGLQITVDGYIFDGKPKTLAIATKGLVNDTTQVAVDIHYPGDIDDSLYQKAVENNNFTNSQLGYEFGMTHAEYMIDASGSIYLIEAANRGGGVFTSEIIVPNVSGIDILQQYIADGLGEKKSYDKAHVEKNTTVLKFCSFASGKVREIQGLDAIENDPSVLKCRLAIKPGDTITPITNDGNRHGFVITTGTNAQQRANDLLGTIQVFYDE